MPLRILNTEKEDRYFLTTKETVDGYRTVIVPENNPEYIRQYVMRITTDGRLQRSYNIGKEFADAVGIQLDSKGGIKMVEED